MSSKKPTFEQAIEQLEDIIDKMDAGEIGLEDALKQYEKGAELIKHCRGVLETAEKRIAELTTTPGGGLAVSEDGSDV